MEERGEVRGATLSMHWKYVEKRWGEKGLEKVEGRMEELGHPLRFREIERMRFYPLGYDVLLLRVIGEQFGFEDGDFEKMGEQEIKFSFFLRVFLHHFTSLSLIAEQAPKMLGEHYTRGEMEVLKADREQRKIVIRVGDFEVDPLYDEMFQGYFRGLLRMLLRKEGEVKETECMFEGDDFHRFVIEW